jgi:hypothetical protein
MEDWHHPHFRDTLDQHPLVKWSWVLIAPEMFSPIAVEVPAHRSLLFVVPSYEMLFQTSNFASDSQNCYQTVQAESHVETVIALVKVLSRASEYSKHSSVGYSPLEASVRRHHLERRA